MSTFAPSIPALPHIFERDVNETTALAPTVSKIQTQLGPFLSKGATLYSLGTPLFENAVSRRSAYTEPNVAPVVEPGADVEVITTVPLFLPKWLTLRLTGLIWQD